VNIPKNIWVTTNQPKHIINLTGRPSKKRYRNPIGSRIVFQSYHCSGSSCKTFGGGISNKYWLVVSTQLKNIRQNGKLPQIGVKIKIFETTTQPISNKYHHPWKPVQIDEVVQLQQLQVDAGRSPEKEDAGGVYPTYLLGGWDPRTWFSG